MSWVRHGGLRRVAVLCGAVLLIALSGCAPDADYGEVLASYQSSSKALNRAAESLLENANRVEAENYILKQAVAGKVLAQDDIDRQVLLSPEGLALRKKAIAALSQYTSALAELASGKTEDQIAADAAAAGTSLSGLTADVQTALAKDNPAANTASWSGPIAAAASAAGELVQLVEKRRSRMALRASLEKNDPAMKALSEMIARDAEFFYFRQRQTLELRGVTLYSQYELARQAEPKSNGNELMTLGDRIEAFRKSRELLAMSDPKAAFESWRQSHDALVAALVQPDKSRQRASLLQAMANVKRFAAEVMPLATNIEELLTATV